MRGHRTQGHRYLTGAMTNSILTVDRFLSRSILMKTDPQKTYQQLQSALGRIGYFRRGTLLKRFMPCGKPGCACMASPPRLHGPYYQWTRKVGGKTVTVRLTAEQAQLMSTWITNGRKMDRIIAQMESLALDATDRMLKELPPPTRKRLHARVREKRSPRS